MYEPTQKNIKQPGYRQIKFLQKVNFHEREFCIC